MKNINNRIFSPSELANRRSAKTVYSTSELISYITTNSDKAYSVILGADLYIDSPIIIPATTKSFKLNGNGFKITLSSNLSNVFDIRCGTASVRVPIKVFDLEIVCNNYSLTYLLGNLGSSTVYCQAFLTNVSCDGNESLVQDTLFRLQYSTIDSCVFTNASGMELIGDAYITNCIFTGNLGTITVQINNGNSLKNLFIGMELDSLNNTYTPVNTDRNLFVDISGSPLTYSQYDMVVSPTEIKCVEMQYVPTEVSLVSDNQVLTAASVSSFIVLNSDSFISTNRTFTLSAGSSGQRLILLGGTNASELADSGNCQLAGTMTFGTGDTLSLIFNGTTWYETGRSNN